MIRKKFLIVLILFTVILSLGSITSSGCSSRNSNTENSSAIGKEILPFAGQELVLSGSTTLLQVSEAWASGFMDRFGGTIILNGGGSGSGIADLVNGINELANSSRAIKDKEIDEAKNAGLDISEFTVLFDSLAIIVSENVTVKDLSVKELSDIMP